jgi:hypothetical protein
MTPREHALLARTLIGQCGGIDEAVRACKAAGWQIKRSMMSYYQNPNHRSSMSAEVIAILESYCGRPTYSRVLFERHALEYGDDPEDIVEEVSDATESVAALQAAVRKAAKDDKFTPTELELIRRLHRKAMEELRDAGMAIPEHES